MVPVIDAGQRLGVKTKALPYKSDYIFAKELEDELMKFTTGSENSKVDSLVVEQTQAVHGDVDFVDIMECKKSDGNAVFEVENQQITESSSSFDNSGSEHDTSADAESVMGSDVFGDIFRTRTKKVTPHWRSYIQPLTWRCKWVELQIKKLEAQAKKYDRKLGEYSQQKHIQSENSTLEGIGVKLLPFPQKNATNEVLRRKKRKKTETSTDIAAYMSNHNLFSYYENKKSNAEGTSMDKFKSPAKITQKVNIDDELWANDESLLLESEVGDNSVEHLLKKIFSLESHIENVKSRVGKVNEIAAKFTYPENLSLPMPSHALPGNIGSPNNGDGMSVGTCSGSQLIPGYDYMDDVFVPEIGVGEAVADVNRKRDVSRFADSLQIVKEEMNKYEGVKIQPIQKQKVKEVNFEEVKILRLTQAPLVLKDGSDGSAAPFLKKTELPQENQPPSKFHSVSQLTAPTSTSKRGRRKGAGRGRGNHQV